MSSFPFERKIVGAASTKGEVILYKDPEEEKIFSALENKTDFNALRLKRLFEMSDLTRRENSPVKLVLNKVLQLPIFKGFDVLQIPESIAIHNAFDLFDFSADHPARRETDTYFITPERIFRTHTTSMWFYYLTDPAAKKKMEERGWAGIVAHGKVYRKDEIDHKHFPVFHQIDGLYLCKKADKMIGLKDLQDVLSEIVKGIFGPQTEYRFLEDEFPFTDPSTQIEIKFNNDWLEVVGAGICRNSTLQKLGIDPSVWNGWAFGFGIDRLAMMKMNISDIRVLWSDDPRITRQFTSIDSRYKEVSKYPSVIRDISFIVKKEIVPNRFYEIVREVGGVLVEEVKKTDEYENDSKLGAGNKSYTFRIIYRSFEKTLTNDEVNLAHKRIEEFAKRELDASIR